MKSSTQDFIESMVLIILIGGGLIMFFFGIGYLLLHAQSEDQQMYNKCIDTCERVFQEQKLIDCITTCNQIPVKNITRGGSG